ncbi:hypothetical protein C2G38_2247772 [Gigaspora rosea]|uniref:Uncharacterized protein n=1 Tax=Gigaspora rosea TaxID=44941 RepID=A0A397UZT2_9GLOM|nr:hypothetical protein C2G38_2247772 [Gigaspora rosea]
MVLNIFEKLSNSYLELLNDEEDFNIIINVANINSDENNVKTVNLKHVSIQQFEIIINYLELLNDEEDFNIIINVTNINSDENNIKTVNLNMFLPNNLKSLSISLENLGILFIFNLMLIACELLFEELAECLEAFLIIDR